MYSSLFKATWRTLMGEGPLRCFRRDQVQIRWASRGRHSQASECSGLVVSLLDSVYRPVYPFPMFVVL